MRRANLARARVWFSGYLMGAVVGWMLADALRSVRDKTTPHPTSQLMVRPPASSLQPGAQR